MKRLLQLVFFLALFVQTPAHAEPFSGIDHMVGDRDAVAVAAPGGTVIYSKNADTMLVPASILKILTALVALEHLGPDYRFPTDFYLDGKKNLIVKGYGDPFLVSETVAEISLHLAENIDEINHLVMDNAYFDDIDVPGTYRASIRSYDAPSGALCVNFNTIFFTTTADGSLASAEEQTPLLPTAVKRIHAMGASKGRVMLSPDGMETTRYAGELIRYFLEDAGIAIKGDVQIADADSGGIPLVHRHYSDIDLSEMVYRMMEYSNNFIANQLLLAAGAKAYGAPATLEKGVRAARQYAEKLGIDPEIVEGSGISRGNRITANMMITVLEAFAPNYELLQKRGRVYYKTGTLTDIQTRAGYIEGKDGVLYRFAVMRNTPGKPADPVVDRIAAGLR